MAETGFWGPQEGIDSKDYLMMMEGSTPVSRPERLVGHSMTSPNFNRSDALQMVRVKLQNGRIRTYTVTKRAPELRSVEYTIGFPSGALYTPALAAALRPNNRNTFYLKYLCASDRRFNHAYALPDATLDSPQPEGDLITIDQENAVTETSTLRTGEQVKVWALGYSLAYTDSSADPLYAAAFKTFDCPSEDDVPGLDVLAGGGDGTAAPLALSTDDRFESVTNPTTGIGTAKVITDIYTDGDIVVVAHSDKELPSGPATAGGIVVSTDDGANFAAVSGITVPIFGVDRIGDTFVAVGGTGAGAAKVYIARGNVTTWTEVASVALPGTDALAGVAVDEYTGRIYMVGESGTLLVAQLSGSAMPISDISANLPGTPGLLTEVAVLGDDHVAVGGAAGYFAESFDGGATFQQKTVAGSTVIGAIGGTTLRTLVGAGTNLYERDILTNMDFKKVVLEDGQAVTGNYTAIATGVDEALGRFNMFVAVTDDSEVVIGKPFYPGA